MNSKQKSIIAGLAIIVLVSGMSAQFASADCDKWCTQKLNAQVAFEQLQVQHGFTYGHQFANYGWAYSMISKTNTSISD